MNVSNVLQFEDVRRVYIDVWSALTLHFDPRPENSEVVRAWMDMDSVHGVGFCGTAEVLDGGILRITNTCSSASVLHVELPEKLFIFELVSFRGEFRTSREAVSRKAMRKAKKK